MAVSFVAGAAANDGQTSAAFTAAPTIPAAAAAGDTAIFVMAQNSGAATFTPPSGWTSLSGPDFTATSIESQIWVKDLVSGDLGTSPSFSSSASSRLPGVLLVYRGTSAASITSAFASVSSATTSLTSPTITTAAAGTEIVEMWIARVGTAAPSATVTVPAVDTATTVAKTAFTTSPNFTVQTGRLTTTGAAGTYGGNTATSSASATGNIYTLALPAVTTSASGTITPSGGGTTAFASPGVIARASAGLSGAGTTSFASAAKTASGSLALSGGGVTSLGVSGGLAVAGSGGLSFSGAQVTLSDSLFLAGDGSSTFTLFLPTGVFSGVLAQRRMPLMGSLSALTNYSKAVLRINGEWVEAEYPTEWQIDAADLYFPGGYETIVDGTTANLLRAAGYTVEQVS